MASRVAPGPVLLFGYVTIQQLQQLPAMSRVPIKQAAAPPQPSVLYQGEKMLGIRILGELVRTLIELKYLSRLYGTVCVQKALLGLCEHTKDGA